ncbi:MAG: O-antigen ligase family protein [Bacilli bacterium]|jgi:hypothetical protein
MNKKFLNSKIYFSVIFCVLFLMFLFYTFALYSYYSLFLDILFILLVIWFIITAYKNLYEDRILLIFIFILIFFIGALIGFNLDMLRGNFAEYGAIISLIIMIYIAYRSDINISEMRYLSKLYYFLPYILLIKLLTNFSLIGNNELRFGFENQNSFALYMLLVLMNNVLCLLSEKKIIFKIIGLISLALSMIFLYFTGSRTSFIIAIIFGLSVLFMLLKKKTNKFACQATIFTGMLFPILLPLIYIALWKILGSSNVTILGRTVFTNREHIWIQVPSKISLFLNSHYLDMDNFLYISQGAHNIYLSFAWGYGIFAFFIFMSYFLTIVYKKVGQKNKQINRVALVAFALLFLHGSFEDIFYRNVWVIVFGFVFFMMSSKDIIINNDIVLEEKEVCLEER